MADHSERYSESSFWRKTARVGRRAGREVLEKSLWLYFAMQKQDCPAWAKTAIVGALGYFILPIDAIPDFIPLLGFTDDLGVLAGAVATVAKQIDGEVKEKAEAKLKAWGM
jgi:uncharacterized membrane protein YkvA (DUF1232 family)